MRQITITNPPSWVVYEIEGRDKTRFQRYSSEKSAETARDFLNKTAGYEKYTIVSIRHYKDREDE